MTCDICDGTYVPRTRDHYIHQLRSGDIFWASRKNKPSVICLVDNIDNNYINSRVITMQFELSFERENGQANNNETNTLYRIESVEPLPLETHNVILGLDRKMRLYHDSKLDKAEIKALRMLESHYSKYPLPSVL